MRSAWESYGRRWQRYRGDCLATALVGLALTFLGIFWTGLALLAVAVAATIA